MVMDSTEKLIWELFHIHKHDTLPFTGWAGNRTILAELFAKLGFKKAAEIGVCKGEYSEVLLQNIPGLEILCVDPWCAYNRIKDDHALARYEEAVKRLSKYPGAKMIKKTSMEAVVDVPENSLDFVYIDGLHTFNAVMQDIIEWEKRVRVGGIVAGHDYYHFYQAGVVRAVDAYTYANNISAWYVTNKEKEPSWFWVRR